MPVRFCAQCGAKAVAGARYCMQCGTQLGSATGSGPSARWQLTLAGSVVLALFLSAGLTVWALILAPSGPRPGPGGPAPSPAAAGPGIAAAERPEAHPKVELPAEVKTFLADLSAKAKAKPDD